MGTISDTISYPKYILPLLLFCVCLFSLLEPFSLHKAEMSLRAELQESND